MVRGHQHLIIPFIPLFCGGGVFVLFYWFTQYIGPFVIHQHTAQVCFASDLAIVTKAAFAEYLVIGHFLLLLVLEAGIVVFAIATVYCRRFAHQSLYHIQAICDCDVLRCSICGRCPVRIEITAWYRYRNDRSN